MTAFTRNLRALEDSELDLLVIGGGINGVGIAWDASLRGLRVGLVERSDFGGEASAGCFKIVHGGLRYLQQLDLRRVFESAHEQRALRLMAPHLLRPLPFVVPCYGYGKKGRPLLECGMTLYDLLTPSRNRAVQPELKLPKHSWLSRKQLEMEAPGLPCNGLTGGMIFYDAQMECERLTLAIAKSAASAGAVLANYAEVVGREGRDGVGNPLNRIIVEDRLTGARFTIRARFVICAGGPRAGAIETRLFGGAFEPSPWFARGTQLVLDRVLGDRALAVLSGTVERASVLRRGGRAYFLVPWKDATLCGTYEVAVQASDGDSPLENEDVDMFLSELRSAYDSPVLDRKHVRSVFGGLIPLEGPPAADKSYLVCREDRIVDWATSGLKVPNALSVRGTKYTTFRALAEKVVDRVVARLGCGAATCRTAQERVVGGNFDNRSELEASVARTVLQRFCPAKRQRLVDDFGAEVLRLAAQFEERPGRFDELDVCTGFTLGELEFLVEEEMALRLSDVLRRRTDIAALSRLDAARITRIGKAMAKALGWSRETLASEISLVRSELRI
ncbi:MAG: FAD-dependent oxidoreductase [Bdellovibrionota bacterium]